MNYVKKIFLTFLKVLNLLLFVLPSRFSILVLVGYNFLIYLCFGRWSIEAVKDSLGSDTIQYYLFQLFISFPIFWAFICCWSGAKMASSGFSSSTNSSLNNAISYRNGQMGVNSPQKAFEIYRDTSHLDLIKSNEGNPVFDKVIQGFNAKYGNSSPQDVFKSFTNK